MTKEGTMPDSQTTKQERERTARKGETVERRRLLMEYMGRTIRPLTAFEVAEGSGLYQGAEIAVRAYDDLQHLVGQGKLRRIGDSPAKFEETPVTPLLSSRGSQSDGITEADERRGEEMREGAWDDPPRGWEP